ncbi:MAG: outer membrane protein assembly factor BamA [bacterium]|nr:outer membrane protein assembly factor BamA [bacterium]
MSTCRARIALIGACFLLLAFSVAAQPDYRINEVVVEGNHRASKSLILGAAALDVGSPLSATDISASIRRLYRLDIFSDVHIDAEPVADGLKVFIVVKERPKLIGLNFKGNDKIKSKDFKEKLGLAVGGYISPNLIKEKMNEMKKLYDEKGYFQASIKPELDYSPDSSDASLTFAIDERSKVKVENVVITGNVRVKPSDLVGKMRNRKRGFLRSSDFARDKYAEDLEKVITELHNRGYTDAYLISDSMTIDTVRSRMTIFLQLYEGPQYYFGEVEFVNNDKLSDRILRKSLKFKSGDVFNGEGYDETIYELYSAYQEIGHLHTQILDERATVSDSIVNVTYTVTEGLPSHINLVHITGNHKTKDKIIRREISSLPGQVFSRARLIRSVRDVMALNFFSNVLPEPISLPNGDVDVEFKVEEKQTGQISAGAGYNSEDKVVGTLGMAIPNFRGNGQNLTFNVDFGSRRNSTSVSFTEPWLLGRPTLFGTDLYTTNRRWYDDYTEGRQGGSIRLGRRLRWPDNYFRVHTTYRLERNRFDDFDDSYRLSNSFKRIDLYDVDKNGNYYNASDSSTTSDREPYPGSILTYDEKWQTASRISFTITRDSRDLPEFATSGSKISYTFENTGGFLGGFWSYQKHSFSAAKFFPLFWNMALAAKVQYGAVTSPNGDSRIFLSDRFTPGGTAYDGIVRGYDDGVLTPDSLVTFKDTVVYYSGFPDSATYDSTNLATVSEFTTRVRGKYMLISNIELQYPVVRQQIYAMLFFDAGNSWLNQSDIKPLRDLYKGFGIGFRIVVPGIGTIGFDFARRLDDLRGEGLGWKPHFQIGTTFR